MPSLGSLWYTMGIRDMTDADLKKINDKLKNAGSEILINPKLAKSINEILPKGIKIELDPQLKSISNDALAKAAEGKVMKVEIAPLITNLRKALKDATVASPPEIEVGVQAVKLRNLISQVLTRQGFMINVSTVTGNFSKTVQQQLNGTTYKVKIHADASEIARSVQTSLMQVQSRYFGLQVSKDILRNSIDQALMGKPFNIQIAVMHDQARRAVQNALNNARMVGKDDALAFQRLQTGELKAAQAELARLKAAHMGAAKAAKAHATASASLGGAMGRNITIAGELGSAMTSLYSIHAAKQFLSQVVEIGGELEHQKIALEAIYGSGSKMETLYGKIKGLARESPFGVMDLTKNIKQLSAYGVEYNEVYDTAKRLADISAATSVDINRLILAFGKTKNRTFLDGLEAKQFAYANIPIYDALSKKLTELEGKFVSVRDVMGRIKKREIGFDMVKEILWDMTDEGGKFYNMQEKLAGSVKTSWKLVKDNIQLMFGEIAESNVGSLLKDTGAIAQNLTRDWKTLLTVIAAGAGAFGIYKVATLAMNAALGASSAAALKEAAATNSATAATAKHAMSYRALTAEEAKSIPMKKAIATLNSKNILTNKALTSSQIRGLAASKLLTKDLAARAIAMGKISPMQARYLIQTGVITQADLRAAVAARKRGVSVNIMGKEIRLASFRFKEMAVAAGLAAKSLLGMVFNPATLGLAALGTAMTLWSKNSEEMEKVKEAGDGIFSKAVDGAKELKSMLETMNPADSMSELELTQGIERLEQAIKDYSPTPIEDINKALVAQDGHVNTLIERYEKLKSRTEELAAAFEAIKTNDLGGMIKGALEATDGGNWFTQMFDDSLDANGKDFTKALKRRDDAIAKFATENRKRMVEVVDAAVKADEGFAKAAEGLDTYEAKLRELISNFSKYGTGYVESGASLLDLGNYNQIKAARDEFLADTERFVSNLKSRLNMTPGFDINSKEGALQLTMALRSYLDSMESWGDEAKETWARQMEKIFTGVHLTEDKIGKEMRSIFNKMLADSKDKIVDDVVKEWGVPTADIGKELGSRTMESLINEINFKGIDNVSIGIQAIFDTGMMKAKDVAMEKLGETTESMQEYLTRNPLDIIVSLVFNKPSSKIGKMLWDHGDNTEFSEYTKIFNQWASGAESVKDVNDKAVEEGKKIMEELEAAKKNANVPKEHIEALQKKWDIRAETFKRMGGGSLEDAISSKSSRSRSGGSQKDTFADNLRQRFKDIKDAWSEFQKWSKTEGRKAAATRIGESGLFSTLSVEQIPQTVEQYRTLVVQLENELRKAGVKGSARESLLNDLLKQLLDIDKSVVDEQLKLALDKVSKESERQLADWNLFDKIRKATGNQDLAMSIAFGMNADAETDYPAMVKKQFAELAKAAGHDITFDNTTLEQAKNLGDDIAKSYQDTAKKLEQYARQQKDAIADILNEYQSLQDKLTKIDADRDRKIETVNRSDMSDADKAKYIQRINVEADYQKFTQSNEYLQFFAGVYALTEQEATRIGDLIEQNLNRRLQAGTISAEDYYKEIERVKQQLDKIRNVKSDALTFLTGGVKGLNDKRQETNDAARLQTIQKIEELEQNLAEAKASGDMYAVSAAEAQLEAAKKELSIQDKIRDKLIQNQQQWQKILDIANIASSIAGGMSDAFNSIKDMADALGVDTESGAWGDIGAVMDTLTSVTGGVQKTVQSAMSGDIGGVLGGVVSTITTPFTIWSKLHDKKLQKLIDRSKEAAQIMQNQYDILEKRMANFLGNAANMNTGVTGGAYGKQRQLMQGQLTELEKQRQAEIDKKKTDNSVVEDYNKQIEEMKISIRDFALEAAKDLYSIDLNGWAEQLGNSLVDAFAAGEDAAEAFDKTVGDILRDVTSKMISQDILAPMFGDLRNFLFGENGMGGAFGADFKLDSSEVAAMKEYLDKIKNQGIPAAEELFNAINSATGGMLDDTEKAKSGLSAGIQSVTEDTADLLASYVNAIRASVALNEGRWERLLGESLPQIGVIAQSQLDAQKQIAENTLRTAKATEAIVKSNDDISRLLTRVSQGGAKFHV